MDLAGSPLAQCQVVNISSTGARLNLREPATLPESFFLVLSKNSDVQRRCELIWHSEKGVSVRFLRPTSEKRASYIDDALARMGFKIGEDAHNG